MGVFRSVLGLLGVSNATKAPPVPISSLKERFFKPKESADFDDLLNTAISLGVTVSVDSAALDRGGDDGKYDPVSNNIVMPALPDRSKPEFYKLMEILSHEMFHASKYKLVLSQANTEQARLRSLRTGAARQTLSQFVEDNLQREWAAENNALTIVFDVAQKDPKAPILFKNLNVPAGLNRYKSKHERHYRDSFLALYLSWANPDGTKTPGETAPEIEITPSKPKPTSQPAPKSSPSPAPPEKTRRRPGGYNLFDPAKRYRSQMAANQSWQQTIALRRQNEAIAETNRRIRATNQSFYDAQRRNAAGYQPGKSFFPGTTAASFPNASISRGAPGRYSSSSSSSDWWRRQRPGMYPQTTPPLPSQSTTFQRRPGYGGGMFDNLFRPGSPAPAGLRYPWDSPGWRSYKEPRNRTYDR